jgi:hypothetical protein
MFLELRRSNLERHHVILWSERHTQLSGGYFPHTKLLVVYHSIHYSQHLPSAIMSGAAANKIAPNSPSRASPSEIETSIANALHDLETNIPDMRSAIRPLQFVTAREVR